MEWIVFLAAGAAAGLLVGLAVGWSRWGRRRVERARAVDSELQAARQRAERATGEAQALRTRLVSAEVTAARAAATESDLVSARHEAEVQAARADRMEQELAVLRGDDPGAVWPRTDPSEAALWPPDLEPSGAGVGWGVRSGTHGADGIDPPLTGERPSIATVATQPADPTNGSVAVRMSGTPAEAEPSAPAIGSATAPVVEAPPVVDTSLDPHVSPAADVLAAPVPALPAADSMDDVDATPAEVLSTNGTGRARTRRSARRGVRSPRATIPETSEPMDLAPGSRDQEPAVVAEPAVVTREATAPVGVGSAAAPRAVVPGEALDAAPPAVERPPVSDGLRDLREEPDPAAWLGTIAPNGVRYAEDDLQRIHGVGPFLARRLNEAGIRTWRQIAMWDEDQMAAWSRRVGSFPDRIRREDWVGSARSLHEEAYGERLP